MICCLLAAAIFGPLGLWMFARAPGGDAAACCVRSHRTLWPVAIVVLAFAALCLGAWLLTRNGPATFHHICRFIPGFAD